jgi:hypothetical protein
MGEKIKLKKVKSLDELDFGDVVYTKGGEESAVVNHFMAFTTLKELLKKKNLYKEK